MNSLLQMSHPAATQPAQEAAYPVLSTAVPQLNISLVPLTFSNSDNDSCDLRVFEASNQPVKNVPSAGIQKAEIEQNVADSDLEAGRLLQSDTE